MLINWFTVIAQIANFLILVVLLKFLLYDRIIRAMDQREEIIRSRLQDAERKKKDGEQEAEALRAKNRELDEKREEMFSQAKVDAEAYSRELIEQTRDRVEHLKKRWQDAVQRESESFLQELRRMTAEQVYAIARRALEDLADADLEERAIEAFLAAMQKMEKPGAVEPADLINHADKRLLVASSFDIPIRLRKRITRAVHQHISDQIDVTYERSAKLILGIELKAQGRKISWSLDDYLETLETHARETLERISPRG